MPSQRAKPRSGARLNPSDPLAKGLIGAWLFNEGGGSIAHDATRQGLDGSFANAQTWGVGPYGPTLNFNGSSNYISFNGPAYNKGLTLATIANPSGTGLGVMFGATNTLAAFTFKFLSGNPVPVAVDASQQARVFTTPGIAPANTSSLIVLTYDLSGNYVVYANGLAVYSGSSGQSFASSFTPEIGVNFGSTEFFKGSMDLALYYPNRILTPAEVRALYNDPFRMFRPRRRVLYGASGGNVTVSLTGQSVTTTAGTLAPTTTVAATGQSVTTAAGTVAPNTALALTGQSAATTAGTVSPATTVALAGQSVATTAGTTTPKTTVGLTGQGVTTTPGNVSVPGNVTVALTGQSVATAAGQLAAALAVALTGRSAATAAGTVKPAASVVLAGQSVATGAGTVTPSGGSLALFGRPVSLAGADLSCPSLPGADLSAITLPGSAEY